MHAPELLPIVPELVRPVHPLEGFLALRKLEKIFREQKPDIVHTHSGKAGILDVLPPNAPEFRSLFTPFTARRSGIFKAA